MLGAGTDKALRRIRRQCLTLSCVRSWLEAPMVLNTNDPWRFDAADPGQQIHQPTSGSLLGTV